MTTRAVGEMSVPAPAAPTTPAPRKRPLGTRRKLLLGALVLVPVVAGATFVAYERSRPAESAFRTVRVVRADITASVTATGTLQPVITSPVGAQVSGIVWKLHADYNSPVLAGQVLVELDPALFQNAVAMATAQLAQAEANLTSAQATALGARIARDRTRRLEQESLATSADLDATAAIFGQTTGLSRSSAAQVAQARAQLERAQLDFEHSVIRSTVNGTVISRNIDVGQAVAATLTAPTLFTIAQDLHHMQVHAAVDEADIGEVRAGQSATFTVDAFRDQTFAAVVQTVRNAPQTAQNVVTYDVVLDVDNPEGKLRPGMTANVIILLVHKSQVVAVPNEALRFRPAAGPAATGAARASPAEARAGAAVYVPEGAGATRVAVQIGVTDGDVARDRSKAPAGGGSGRGL
jgi:HlyD family secretion protein